MKLIHCADLHLDSPMESNLSSEQARERKNEILGTFARLVRLANESRVAAILISGDLFDSKHITKRTERYVLDLIRKYPDLCFFYLAGNHDSGSALSELDEEQRPSNLYLFGEEWQSYDFGDVVITGSENPDPDRLELAPDALNIVMLHGQETGERGVDKRDVIRFSKLKNKNIDYLALGHLHTYRTAQLDDRCIATYSGCLEGRGFDECGQKGFVLLEIEAGRIEHRFIPIARRELHTVTCDVTGVTGRMELEERVRAAIESVPASSLVKLILTGECPAEQSKDIDYLLSILSEKFYFAKIYDETRLLIRPEDYRNDISLKGEFVRRVLASDLDEHEKECVLACGLRALCGEEVEV
ncbi:MAG: metallophosphoesterase [Clostridia bacterium]|nr:metallophosphoesterase [Clostridia bacterium]